MANSPIQSNDQRFLTEPETWQMRLVKNKTAVLLTGIFVLGIAGLIAYLGVKNPKFAMCAGVAGSSFTVIGLGILYKAYMMHQKREREIGQTFNRLLAIKSASNKIIVGALLCTLAALPLILFKTGIIHTSNPLAMEAIGATVYLGGSLGFAYWLLGAYQSYLELNKHHSQSPQIKRD